MSGVTRIGVATGATGVVAGSTLLATSRAKHEPAKGEKLDDGFGANIDGWARIGAGALALSSLLVAGAAAITRHPKVALGSLGVGTALAGSALLVNDARTTSLRERAAASVTSAGAALNGAIHASHMPERPDVAKLAPSARAAAEAARIPRPSADQIASAKLRHLPQAPDMQLAQANADKAIASIDWSRRDIVLWMPGTGSHDMSGHWIRRVAEDPKHFDGGGSAVLVDYPASLDFSPSVATGMETLRLVLAEIARRGGDHRVLVGGHSQGAWVVADAMATPAINAAIDRAVLFGKPGLARTSYTDGHDAKVLELNDGNDPVAKPVADRQLLIDGMRDFDRGITPSKLPRMLHAALANADLASFWVARSEGWRRWQGSDPHLYDSVYRPALDWLEAAPARAGDGAAAH